MVKSVFAAALLLTAAAPAAGQDIAAGVQHRFAVS